MAGETRGVDVVVIGLLIYLVWEQYTQQPLGGCLPGNIANQSQPVSSITGPAWLQPGPGVQS